MEIIKILSGDGKLRTGVYNAKGIGKQLCVFYDKVPLFMTIYSDVNRHIVRLVKDSGKIFIQAKIPVHGKHGTHDITSYGEWKTEKEALDWLDNPVDLY